MTNYVDEVAESLRQRVDDLPDLRPGEEMTAYVSFVETTWTDDCGERRSDLRRIVSPGLNSYHAAGVAMIGAKRIERDLDTRHFPTVPAVVPLTRQART